MIQYYFYEHSLINIKNSKVLLKEFVRKYFDDSYNISTLKICNDLNETLEYVNNIKDCVIKRNDDSDSVIIKKDNKLNINTYKIACYKNLQILCKI